MFYVIDVTNMCLSWDDQNEESENFETELSALNRAEQLARENPGEEFHVVAATMTTSCPIGEPSTKFVRVKA